MSGESDFRSHKRAYLEVHGKDIKTPRPLQIMLRQTNDPDEIDYSYSLALGEKPQDVILGDAIPSMPWNFDPTILENKPENTDHQINPTQFILFPDSDVVLPKREVNRDEFGPGDAGQRAYYVMQNADGCERVIDSETKKYCGNEPVKVLEYDVLGDLEQRAVCGDECIAAIKRQVDDDLAAIGRNTVFGINGFGRG